MEYREVEQVVEQELVPHPSIFFPISPLPHSSLSSSFIFLIPLPFSFLPFFISLLLHSSPPTSPSSPFLTFFLLFFLIPVECRTISTHYHTQHIRPDKVDAFNILHHSSSFPISLIPPLLPHSFHLSSHTSTRCIQFSIHRQQLSRIWHQEERPEPRSLTIKLSLVSCEEISGSEIPLPPPLPLPFTF